MKTQTSTPTLSSGRARAERCKELEEEKESNATEYGTRDSQEVETEPKKPTQGKETDGRRPTRQPGRRPRPPRLKQGTAQASRTGQAQTCTATTNPVEGSEAPRNHSPEAGATQERAQAPRHSLNTRMTASTSQRRHGATARVRPTHGTRHRR